MALDATRWLSAALVASTLAAFCALSASALSCFVGARLVAQVEIPEQAVAKAPAAAVSAPTMRAPVPVAKATPPATPPLASKSHKAVEPERVLPKPEPCDAKLRVSGSAYVPPSRGQPIVVFSGPDEQDSGARSVGDEIAGKTITAIYPNIVLLTDSTGAQCWLSMRSVHASAVAAAEHRAHAKDAAKARRKAAIQKRQEARKRVAKRKAERAKKEKR